MLRDSARRFLANERAWAATRLPVDPAERWRDYREMGWIGMGLPEALGGLEAGLPQCCAVLEEAGRHLVADSLGDDLLVTARLAGHVDAQDLEAAIPGIGAGEARVALLASPAGEPPLLLEDGQLLGRTALSVAAASATHWLVVARDTGTRTSKLVTVAREDLDGCGYEIDTIDGRRAAHAVFDRPCPHRTVATRGDGGELAAELQDALILAILADALGAMQAGLDLTVDYVKTRRQFGQPLSSFQAVQHLLAESYCEIEKFRSLVLGAIHLFDAGAEARGGAVAAAKAFLGRNGLQAVSRCIQVSGGIAMTQEYFLGHVYKRVQVSAALGGSSEHHLAALSLMPRLHS